MDDSQRYNQGLEKMRQGDYQGAIKIFNQAIAINPYLAEAYCQRGLAYFDLGQIHEAISNYTQALQLNPDSSVAYYSRALARLKLKNLPGSLEDINQTLRLNEKDAAAYQLRGIIHRKMGAVNAAIGDFKKAAQFYLERKDKAGCRRCLELIKPLQPQPIVVNTAASSPSKMISESEFYQNLIEQAEQGNCRGALGELEWILQADPQDGNAYCCRGIIYFKLENYRQAMADLNQALKLNPENILAYRNRGKVRSQLGDHLGAIADFNYALNQEPNDIRLYLARGNAYRLAGNYPDAIADYTQALYYNPKESQAYYYRGMAYACLEELEQAIADYQQAASQFCEQENWDKYQMVLDHLKRLQTGMPQSNFAATAGQLRQRLLRLVGGQWPLAQRLIDRAKYDYPGMAEDWYLEKVIKDIERDRQ